MHSTEKNTLKLNKINKLKEKEPKRNHKKQKPTYLHSQESHKNITLEAIIYTQKGK